METLLIKANIFGFAHVLDNRPFFIFMLVLGLLLSVLMNFFRSQLENWFDKALVRERARKLRREHKRKNKEEKDEA